MSSHCLKVAVKGYRQSVAQRKGKAAAHQSSVEAALLKSESWKESKLPQST